MLGETHWALRYPTTRNCQKGKKKLRAWKNQFFLFCFLFLNEKVGAIRTGRLFSRLQCCCCLGCTPEVDVLHDNYVYTQGDCCVVACACVCRALPIYRWNYFSTTKSGKKNKQRRRTKNRRSLGWGESRHKWIAESHWCGWRWWVWWFSKQVVSLYSISIYIPQRVQGSLRKRTAFYDRGVLSPHNLMIPNSPSPSAEGENKRMKPFFSSL